MDGTMLVAAGTLCLSSLGFLESYLHRRRLSRIPIRIHVNGTRGKSGVTRLIAAGLRAGGIRTCAKTTGTLARMIFPDGSEYPMFRPSRANVKEQLRVVRAATRCQAEALVMECMALHPQLQSLCELKLVQSTHGVITNARADHLDVMGPTAVDVAKALAGTVPVAGKLFTAEHNHQNVLSSAAADRGSEMVTLTDEEIASLTWDEMERFSYIEHPENVALALRVCRDLGIDRQVALRGMWQAIPDPGVMKLYERDELGRRMIFVNGFAANDPESTGMIWDMIVQRYARVDRHIAVINCRADRPDRSVQLAEACLRWKPAHHYVVIGSATHLFTKRATALGLDNRRITSTEECEPGRLVQAVQQHAGHSSMVMGMGNISGPGMDLVNYFQREQAQRSSLRLAA